MRKAGFLVFFLLFAGIYGLGFCGGGAAEAEKRWAVGADFAYVMPEDAEYKESSNFLGRAGLTYSVNKNLAVELEGGYFRLKSKNDTKTRVFTLLGNFELRAKSFGKFTPYAVGGIGVAFFSYADLHPTETKDKSFSHAWKAGGGIEYCINNNWAVNFEAVHFYADTGGKAHLDVYSQQLSLGVKYYF